MTRRLLALDTTHEFGSLALFGGDTLIEEVPMHAPKGFAHVLHEHIEALLGRHGFAANQIDCFAAASGPGSFTGVRVGLACIKGLAEATARPAVAISNLRALSAFGAGPLRAVLMDARRSEIYAAIYNNEGEPVMPEIVTRIPEWLATLPAGVEFVSADLLPDLSGTRFENAMVHLAPASLAAAVGRFAMAELLAGRAQDPAALDANYVRRSDAELFWTEK